MWGRLVTSGWSQEFSPGQHSAEPLLKPMLRLGCALMTGVALHARLSTGLKIDWNLIKQAQHEPRSAFGWLRVRIPAARHVAMFAGNAECGREYAHCHGESSGRRIFQ